MINYKFAQGERKIEKLQEDLDRAFVSVILLILAIFATVLFLLGLSVIITQRNILAGAITGGLTGLLWGATIVAYRREGRLRADLKQAKEDQKDLYFDILFTEDGEIPDTIMVHGEETNSSLARAMVQRERLKNGTLCYSVRGDHKVLLGKSPEDLEAAAGVEIPARVTHEGSGFHAVRWKDV